MSRFLWCAFACLLPAFQPAHSVPPLSAPSAQWEEFTRESVAKGDFAGMREALADRLRSEAPASSPASVETPGAALALAQWRFLHDVLAGDPKALATVAKGNSGGDFLQWLLTDREALEEYLGITTVLTINANRTYGLEGWRDIWYADSGSREPGLWRRVAAACAASFAVPRAHATPKERYDFYRESERAGELVPYFEKALPFELALTVHAGGRGNDELEWAQDATPKDKKDQKSVGGYGHSLVAYRLDNYRGQSVQGAEYFDHKYNDLGNIMEYGSVCGGISNMNMTVANAHGAPAFTVGQPGHCAYIWKSDDKTWSGGNFVSGWAETHDAHQQPFWLSHLSANINLVSAAVEAPGFLRSERLRELAAVWKEKDAHAAFELLSGATAADPFHWQAWKDRIEAAAAWEQAPAKAWRTMAAEVTSTFPKYPVAMTDLLSGIESKKVLASYSDKERCAYAAAIARELTSIPSGEQWDLLGDCWDGWFSRQLAGLGVPEKSMKEVLAGKETTAWEAISASKRASVEGLFLAVLPAVETNSAVFKNTAASWLALVANDSAATARAGAWFQGRLAQAAEVREIEMLSDSVLSATRKSADARADLVALIRKRVEAVKKPDPAHIDSLLGLLSRYDFREAGAIGRWSGTEFSGAGDHTIEWDITPLLARADGDYSLNLNFRWSAGAPLALKSVRLFEDDKELGADAHAEAADSTLKPAVVVLRLPKPKPGAKYIVRALAAGGADSAGVVLARAEPAASFNKEDWLAIGGWGGKEIKAAPEITDGWHEMEFDVTKQLQQPGALFVLFKYNSYSSPRIMNVRVFVDGQEVSSDLHSCNPISGGNTMYSLRTPPARSGAKVTVRALFTHADGWGTVYLRKHPAAGGGDGKTV